MAKVIVKFDVKELRDIRGRKTGRVSCRVGEHELLADSKAQLQEMVERFVSDSGTQPRVAYVRTEQEGFRVLVGSQFGVERYRENDTRAPVQEGLIPLHPLGWSPSGDIHSELDCELLHLAQLSWNGEPSPPSWLPDCKRADWDSWVAFQLGYRAAIDEGKTDSEAHAIACGLV